MHTNEHLNSISHLIGAVAALAGLVVLVVFASIQSDTWKIVSFSIYGTTLFLLYIFSTLYHGLHGRAKAVFKKLDHISIYLLIAGTYTPFTLVSIRGAWGWSIFGVIWGLAVIGILIDSFATKGRRILPVIIYVFMGWLSLIAIKPLQDALSDNGFMWLFAGGLFYTLGIIFYAMDDRRHYFHAIWHLFVLAGSICHYITIYTYVL